MTRETNIGLADLANIMRMVAALADEEGWAVMPAPSLTCATQSNESERGWGWVIRFWVRPEDSPNEVLLIVLDDIADDGCWFKVRDDQRNVIDHDWFDYDISSK